MKSVKTDDLLGMWSCDDRFRKINNKTSLITITHGFLESKINITEIISLYHLICDDLSIEARAISKFI